MNPRQSEFHLQTLVGCIRIGAKRRKGGGVVADFTRPMPQAEAVTSRQARQIAAMIGRHHLAGPVHVDAGNPHWVFAVSGFGYEWEQIGAECQSLNRGTRGINVEFARVLNRRGIELRIYERGVGPTPSSGSGALAAVAACHAMDFIDKSLNVSSAGGTQSARISASGESVTLKAPARIVMAGVWSDGDVTAGKKH
jgi:diaminopimelate epimerase